MAGGWSTSLAKTLVAGRRKKLPGVGTEGRNETQDQTQGLEACGPSWEDQQIPASGQCSGCAAERSCDILSATVLGSGACGLSSLPSSWNYKPWGLR